MMDVRAVMVLLAVAIGVSSAAKPSAPQLSWQKQQGSIIHYNIATFAGTQGCNRDNWLQGAHKPATFGVGLDGKADTDSWGKAMQAANITYAVYVAKHNCGFTTWPTKVKLPNGEPYGYSVQNSSCPTCNVVADFLETCKKYNVKPGFYYSIATNTYLNVKSRTVQPSPLLPGQVKVTNQQFYDIALAQLEELWSIAPGELFEVWFDGGLPEDPAFGDKIAALLEKYQPQAAAFNGYPTINTTAVRWIGTEAGIAPDPTWSTGSCGRGNAKCSDCSGGNGGDPSSPDWCPAEVDSTLQVSDTWFYVKGKAVHTLAELQAMYHSSLGRNSNWLLDIAPPPSSTVAPIHMTQYQALGDWIRACYNTPISSASAHGTTTVSVKLPAERQTIDRVRLQEDQSQGQLVHKYTVDALVGGKWRPFSSGTSIGAGKIDLGATTTGVTEVRVTMDTAPTAITLDVFKC
eukprot:m.20744 g.20744  ORF g.20744 m.20744 type:complete len:460 (+) comp6257_c0_seq1:125-1504(+)